MRTARERLVTHIPPCSTSNRTNYLTVCFLGYKVVYKTRDLTSEFPFATVKLQWTTFENVKDKNIYISESGLGFHLRLEPLPPMAHRDHAEPHKEVLWADSTRVHVRVASNSVAITRDVYCAQAQRLTLVKWTGLWGSNVIGYYTDNYFKMYSQAFYWRAAVSPLAWG